ncbi:MAG: hypothetical protein JWO59_3549 [Chloroflexi bacterium]|nr:hypothetical protein [Chloroflexota bacterium]
MICVTTRFRLKHIWALIPMYMAYRRMRHDLNRAPGLIRFAFLVQRPTVCYTLSIWESEAAIITFSNVAGHLDALHRARNWCRDIWSGYWHLDAISKSANQWPGSPDWPTLVPDPLLPRRLVEPSPVEVVP